jgi:hypothetical protein
MGNIINGTSRQIFGLVNGEKPGDKKILTTRQLRPIPEKGSSPWRKGLYAFIK